MKTHLATTKGVSPEYQKLASELYAFAEAHGSIDGKNKAPLTEQHFDALIIRPISSKIQSAVDDIQGKYLPISGMVLANTIRQEARLKINSLQPDLNKAMVDYEIIRNRLRSFAPDRKKRFKTACIHILEVSVGIFEAYFFFESFMSMGLNPILSGFLSVVTGFVIAFGIHVVAAFIKRAKTIIQRLFRYAGIIVPAIFIFIFLGHVRADAYNQASIFDSIIKQQMGPALFSISAWNLTMISLLLFMAVLFLSVHVAKTEEEVETEKLFETLNEELQNKQSIKEAFERQIVDTQNEAEEKSALALKNFEYALSEEKKLLALGKQTLELYVSTNIRFRDNKEYPEFFSKAPVLIGIKTFFQNKNNQDETY